MDKPPPQTEANGNWNSESPRGGRYQSGGPVLTPNELTDIVNHHERNTTDMAVTSRAVPFAPDATGGTVAPVEAVPPTIDAPPLPPHDEAVHPLGEAPSVPEPPTTQARPYRRCLVRRACLCLTLQQGAMCIGIMQVASGILTLLLEVMYLAGVLSIGAYALDDDLTGTLPGQEQRWSSMDVAYASLSGFLLLSDLIILFFAGLLLHGARMKLPGYVRAWLIFTGFMLAIGIGSWAARLTLEFMYKPTRGAALLLRCLIYLTPSVYFLIVVRSFYYELLDEIAGIGQLEVEAQPLMKRDPPPYSPVDPASQQAAPLPAKAPLETDLDAVVLPLDHPDHENHENHQLASEDDSDNEGGFGTGWLPTRPDDYQQAGPLPTKPRTPSDGSETGLVRTSSKTDPGTGPRIVAVVGHDGVVQRLGDSGNLPHFKERVLNKVEIRSQDYDDSDDEVEDTVEIRPTSRRLIGVGPMVLPPLPPGHRESLQHVVMDHQREPRPPAAPTSL